jgi:ABC-type Fe3+/spermidine/putrescine transport system ATPase subunit
MNTEQPTRSGQVSLTGVRKAYGSHVALEQVSLDIAPGEFLSLLGPSGCGKTTLLRCIAGLVRPDDGDIRVDGRSLIKLPAYKRQLGMVFQSYALFPHMTARQNVAFGLRIRRERDMDTRIDAALDLVQMRSFGHHMPRQLSGGQQQRIALARALVTSPRVLLLDEPLAALDAKLREAMQVELRQLQRRLGITTIFVTHDQREALTISDRIAVMHAGRIEQCAAPEEIYNQPRSAVVADFIGQTNKITGRVQGREGERWLVWLEGGTEPVRVRGSGLHEGARVLAMIRPEKVAFSLGQPSAGYAAQGRVTEDLFIGDKRVLYIDTAHGQIAAVAPSAHAVSPGAAGMVAWEPDDMFLFPSGGCVKVEESPPAATMLGRAEDDRMRLSV